MKVPSPSLCGAEWPSPAVVYPDHGHRHSRRFAPGLVVLPGATDLEGGPRGADGEIG